MAVTTSPRVEPVSDDRDHIEQMLDSPGWRIYSDRLKKALDAEKMRLEGPFGQPETDRCRGTIAGLRLAAALPALLIDEAKARK